MKSFVLFTASIVFSAVFLSIVASPDSTESTPTAKRSPFPPSSGYHENDEEMEAGYPYQAMEWQYRMRAHPTGRIPSAWRENALAQMAVLKGSAPAVTATAPVWLPLGPDNIGGRVRSIAIDPTNTSIVYCGSVSGGIWKSTDAGGSWLPTSDMAANLVIGAIAIDPNNSNIIYAGTGEGYFNIDALRGAGILKSTDAGASWALTTTFGASPNGFPYYINDIYIRPDNSSLLFAATNSGLYRSTNAGHVVALRPESDGDPQGDADRGRPVEPRDLLRGVRKFLDRRHPQNDRRRDVVHEAHRRLPDQRLLPDQHGHLEGKSPGALRRAD